jgi:hypothetical protein
MRGFSSRWLGRSRGHGRWGRPEVGDAPDMWVPPVGERVREKRERWAGGGLLGRAQSFGPSGLCGCGLKD